MDLSAISSEELTRLCVDAGESEAWTEFVRRFQKPIALTVLRISRIWGLACIATVDDLVQDTYLRLCADGCRLLRDFKTGAEGANSLTALVRVVASNVAHDYFRNKTAQKRGGTASGQELPDEALLSDLWCGAHDIERTVQLREIDRVLRAASDATVAAREKLIFRLYFQQGLTAAAIAGLPGIDLSTKGVESAIFRVSRYLRLRLNPESTCSADSRGLPEGQIGRIPIKKEGAC
ncbi:MAG: sigma-70 family RNA polymerase sigma factor [Acidobacteriaceae bacterium]|jgi:RNA polymerase sigma-70 factor (ECF subfamily)